MASSAVTPSRRALILCSLVAGALNAQPSRTAITGSVTSRAGDTPIRGAEVVVVGTNRQARSDERGTFSITGVDSGTWVLVARQPGFVPESLSMSLVGAPVRVRFALRAATIPTLSEVVVTGTSGVPAHLDGFERRRARRNGGHFITRADIERRDSRATSDALRGIPGIRMVDSMGVMLAVSSRGAKVNMTSKQVVVNCVVRVGVDGAVKEPGFPVDLISSKDIHGIEVYGGAATIPTEFVSGRRDAYCGLIMIWTRSY